METSLKESHQKPKNILIRYSSLKQMRVNSTYQHPENSHLLKYFPKYYKNLGLNITQKNPLFSKIKKIKKLQRFTGCFKDNFRKALWFKVLGNNRKEIQEVPEIVLGQHLIPKKLLKARLALGNLKFFPNITKIFLPTRKDDSRQEMANFSYITNPFLKYLKNTRRLKALEIYLTGMRNKEMNWMLERLNRMDWLLNRRHSIHIEIDDNYMNHLQELYKKKKISSHLTGLKLPGDLTRFDKNLATIPEVFKNLKFLSIGFDCSVPKNSKFSDFVTGIQNLSSLGNLELGFVENFQDSWTSWKPHSSLHYLKVQLDISDFTKEGHTEPKNLVGHWEEIEALEYLEFDIACESVGQMTFVKSLITAALKKVKRLVSLKCSLNISVDFGEPTGEPFFVEEISHLYESLEKFEFILKGEIMELDFKILKPFVNLRELKINGRSLYYENIEDIVDLLQREGAHYSMLDLTVQLRNSSEWLEDTLKKISLVKREEKNLKILLNLEFKTRHLYESEVDLLAKLCEGIKTAGRIKGLVIDLFFDSEGDCFVNKKELEGVMDKYGEIRNVMIITMVYYDTVLEYIRLDGQKDQLVIH